MINTLPAQFESRKCFWKNFSGGEKESCCHWDIDSCHCRFGKNGTESSASSDLEFISVIKP